MFSPPPCTSVSLLSTTQQSVCFLFCKAFTSYPYILLHAVTVDILSLPPPFPCKRSGDADTHARSQNPPSWWSTPTSCNMTGASLCSESTIGDDILVFTLRGNEHAMCIKVKLPSRGDRLYKWCNYYVAAHELEGTLCQMSRSQTIQIHGLEHVCAGEKTWEMRLN